MKYVFAMMALLSPFLVSCNQTSGSSSSSSENTQQENYVAPQREKKVVKTVTVDAEVFHFIGTYNDGVEKDANRTKLITLDIYDDGSAFLHGGDIGGGWVRYSKKDGYEFECNINNEIYAFNYDF